MRKHFICRPLLLGVAVTFFIVSISLNRAEAATLYELLSAVDSTSSNILNAQSKLAIARSAKHLASAIPNPKLFGATEELESVRENTIGVQQDFSFLWSRSARISASSAAVSASKAALELERLQGYSDILLKLQKLQQLADQLRLLDSVQEHFDDILSANEAREEAGDISGFDAQRVRFEAVSISTRRTALLSEQYEISLYLGRYTGYSFDDLLHVSLDEIQALPFANSEDAIRYAQEHAPELRLTTEASIAANYAVRAAKWSRWPEFALGVGRKSTNADESGLLFEAELELPIFNRRNAEVRSAQAESHRAMRLSQIQSSRLEADVTRAFDVWKGIHSINPGLLSPEALREYLNTAHDLYMSGEFGYIELLDAFTATRSSQDERFEIESAKLAADLQLRQLTGHPILENK